MARSLLPAGMVPQSKAAAYDAIVGDTFGKEAELQNQQNQLVQNLIKDNQGLLNTGYHDWEKYTMKSLDPADPQYKEKLGGAVDYMTRNQINAPAVTAAATREFNNTDIQFAQNKDSLGNVIPAGQPDAGDTITNAMQSLNLDPNDSASYNTNVYNAAEKTAVKNMAKNNPYILDHSVFKTRFKDMVAKHPVYGRKFDLRTTAEAKETYGSVEMDKLAGNLSQSMSIPNNTVGVTKDVNAALKHMKTFDITPEQRQRIMPSIMQALATTDLIPGSGRRGEFGEARKVLEMLYPKGTGGDHVQGLIDSGKISVGIQSKLKSALRRIYQDRFKNSIPNAILDRQVDAVINADSALSTAMSIGRKDAEAQSLHREEVSKSHRASRLAQTKKLNEMIGTGVEGTPLNTIYKDTLARLVGEGTELSSEDRGKLKTQIANVYRRMQGYFVKENKLKLNNEGREALLLGLRRMFVNNVSAQTEGSFWRGMGFLTDFDLLGYGGEMTKGQGKEQLPMLEKLYENLPIPERTADSVKNGLEELKDKLGVKINDLKVRATQAFGPTTDNANQTVGTQ